MYSLRVRFVGLFCDIRQIAFRKDFLNFDFFVGWIFRKIKNSSMLFLQVERGVEDGFYIFQC